MIVNPKKGLLLVCLSVFVQVSIARSGRSAPHGATSNEIDFISDTQQPMLVETLRLHPNHNTKATSLLLSEMLRQKPLAIYMLGDIVALGSSNRKWSAMDRFIDTCRRNNMSVHALLGNHDLMWSRRKGETNFQHRFPDNIDTGFVSITDSIAVVLLNSNFSKLTALPPKYNVTSFRLLCKLRNAGFLSPGTPTLLNTSNTRGKISW